MSTVNQVKSSKMYISEIIFNRSVATLCTGYHCRNRNESDGNLRRASPQHAVRPRTINAIHNHTPK